MRSPSALSASAARAGPATHATMTPAATMCARARIIKNLDDTSEFQRESSARSIPGNAQLLRPSAQTLRQGPPSMCNKTDPDNYEIGARLVRDGIVEVTEGSNY